MALLRWRLMSRARRTPVDTTSTPLPRWAKEATEPPPSCLMVIGRSPGGKAESLGLTPRVRKEPHSLQEGVIKEKTVSQQWVIAHDLVWISLPSSLSRRLFSNGFRGAEKSAECELDVTEHHNSTAKVPVYGRASAARPRVGTDLGMSEQLWR